MRKLAILTALALLAWIPQASPKDVPAPVDKARAAAGKLMKTLKASLEEALKGGPASAIKVCSQIAPTVAGKIAQEENLRIRRVSLRNRSPQGVPDAYEKVVLQMWELAQEQGQFKDNTEVFEEQDYDGGRALRYMKPIFVAAPCLQCHGKPGTDIQPEVLKFLAEKYSHDKATGYKAGDLRGAVTVIVPLEK